MTVRRPITLALALLAVMFGAACGDREAGQLPAETDEPLYIQGVQLKRQTRNAEALNAFLKVIEKRGERAAAESHLEASLLYLHHMKEPVLAYYHSRKYLELQPNSKEAPLVKGVVEESLREFAKRLPGAADGGTPERPMATDLLRQTEKDLDRLKRENAELRAELQTLRGIGAGAMPPGGARAGQIVAVPLTDPSRVVAAPPPPANPAVEQSASPLRPAPGPATPQASTPFNIRTAPSSQSRTTTTAAPPRNTPAPQTRPVATPPAGGRTHTVAQSDSLWKIARRYYGNGANAAKVRAIYEANRDQMKNEGDLKSGMVLRIP